MLSAAPPDAPPASDLPVVIATGVPSAVTASHGDGFAVPPKPYTRHTLGVAIGSIFQPVA